MNDYIFAKNNSEKELQRMHVLEAAADETTIGLLERINIQKNWQCMEIGVGGGSILKWLGSKVSAPGKVIGVDKNIKFVKKLNQSPYELIEGDFLSISTPKNLDLVHTRYVVIHNADDLNILKKIFSSMSPGGYLLIEEPDFASSNLMSDILPLACVKTNAANSKMFADMGLNPSYGLGLPKKLQEIGFLIDTVVSNLHYCQGGSPRAEITAQSIELLKDKLIATCLVAEEDIDTYINKARDKEHWAIYGSTISILAKKN